ncbi:MAG: hypothetical protein CMI54_07825 [Parcubacteria group bacterium]|nr:hypothetical protein [Parcubacteria group bacterium]|tara:strand:- start:1501 stop:1737 length:237 start_codon:yes stop_codon:yes gene_type:complete
MQQKTHTLPKIQTTILRRVHIKKMVTFFFTTKSAAEKKARSVQKKTGFKPTPFKVINPRGQVRFVVVVAPGLKAVNSL